MIKIGIIETAKAAILAGDIVISADCAAMPSLKSTALTSTPSHNFDLRCNFKGLSESAFTETE